MASWKSVRITKPCKLSIENGNLVISDKNDKYRLSLNDTDSIIFEGYQFTITATTITALAKHKIATLFCDKSYMPQAILLPYKQASLEVNILKAQISWSDSFKSILWQLIIESKILNQSDILHYFGCTYEYIDRYIGNIALNDRYNFEAKGARHYWKELFPKIKREQKSLDIRNQALNYAYAICRSMIARDLSIGGFNCALGIWHNNQFNPYNLADDLMEPFRPLIDIAIKILLGNTKETFLTSDLKQRIILIFDKKYIIYKNNISTIRKVTKTYIIDFKRVVLNDMPKDMSFPSLTIEKLDECF